MYEQNLSQAGLTEDEALIYEILLKNGPLKASKVANKCYFSRSLVYKILEELKNKGLVDKQEEGGKVAIFTPLHPTQLEERVEKWEHRAKNARVVLNEIMPQLVSDFNLISGKPNIQFFEGVEGLKKIYNKILAEGKDFYFIRSAYEPVYKEKILTITNEFVKKRVKKNMAVTAITPADDLASPEKDTQWLMKRFMIDKTMYDAPVEIDIFGNKIAILSFGEELIGIIIESKQIAQSLTQLFTLATLGIKTEKTGANY